MASEDSEAEVVPPLQQPVLEQGADKEMTGKKEKQKVSVIRKRGSTKGSNPALYDNLRNLVEFYYDTQDFRLASANRLRQVSYDGIDVGTADAFKAKLDPDSLKHYEHTVRDFLKYRLKDVPIYKELEDIKGIGPIIAAAIISWFEVHPHWSACFGVKQANGKVKKCKKYKWENKYTPGAQPCPHTKWIDPCHPSSWWKYAGLSVVGNEVVDGILQGGHAIRREKGVQTGYNPKVKTLAWKIARSLLMAGNEKYTAIYENRKRYEAKMHCTDHVCTVEECGIQEDGARRCPHTHHCGDRECGAPIGHIDTRAKRYMVKMFLADVWLMWRRFEGLPVTPTWAAERMHGVTVLWQAHRTTGEYGVPVRTD